MDSEGHQFLVLEYISDHNIYGTDIDVSDRLIISQGGNKHPKKTTCGWELPNQMKLFFSKWVPLNDIKDIKPIRLAKYEVATNIDRDPDFAY